MSNQAVIDLLANWLKPLGFDLEIQHVSCENGKQKSNLIATTGSGSGGLILSGHTDTVPFNESLWLHDPFKVSEQENRIYGLGSCDMKSFLAMAITASQRFDLKNLKHPLTIVGSADEETTMLGAKLLADNEKLKGRFCVIGEPTELTPIRQHKGTLMESIKFIGSSGHSSNPALGNNAMEAMIIFIGQLLQYRDQLQRKFQDTAFEIPQPTLNLGHIHGGDNPNRICGDCELHIDIRFLPGMELQELRNDILDIAQEVAEQRALKVECKALFDGVPAMDTDVNSKLTRYIEEISQKPANSVAFGTEAPFYNNMSCETIVFGPGSINQAHQPDEYLQIDQIDLTIKHLEKLIHRFCE